MCMFLRLVPLDAEIVVRDNACLDGLMEYSSYKDSATTSDFTSTLQLLNKINDCKFHPDLAFLITYENVEVLPILDAAGRVAGLAVDACHPGNEWEMLTEKLLCDVREYVNERVKDMGGDCYCIFKDEDMEASVFDQNDAHVCDISYYEIED